MQIDRRSGQIRKWAVFLASWIKLLIIPQIPKNLTLIIQIMIQNSKAIYIKYFCTNGFIVKKTTHGFIHNFAIAKYKALHACQSSTYCMLRAIITRGLDIFYPIFHWALYCRAVYNAERLIFHDFFSSHFLKDAI